METGVSLFREATCAKTLPINCGRLRGGHGTRKPREETIGRGESRCITPDGCFFSKMARAVTCKISDIADSWKCLGVLAEFE